MENTPFCEREKTYLIWALYHEVTDNGRPYPNYLLVTQMWSSLPSADGKKLGVIPKRQKLSSVPACRSFRTTRWTTVVSLGFVGKTEVAGFWGANNRGCTECGDRFRNALRTSSSLCLLAARGLQITITDVPQYWELPASQAAKRKTVWKLLALTQKAG